MNVNSEAMKTLVIFRDCHSSHNIVVKAYNDDDEALYRKMAAKKGWKVAVRKPVEPTCDNCAHMDIRQNAHGENYRHCGLFGQWIPDNEQFPACDYHTAVRKFEDMMTATAKERRAK